MLEQLLNMQKLQTQSSYTAVPGGDLSSQNTESKPGSTFSRSDQSPRPAPLGSSLTWNILRFFFDVVLAALALAFIVFGCLVYKYDGTSSDGGAIGRKLYNIAQYGPTIFPVLFAAVVGGCFHNLATWQLQTPRGATVQFVTQCLGSQSLARAFTTQIGLRAVNPLALAILFVWCFSPLGSQAVLRVITMAVDDSTFPIQSVSVDTFSEYQYGGADGSGQAATAIAFPTIASMLTASLLSTRNQDIWGNVRFPNMEQLEAGSASNSSDWLAMPDTTTNLTYASLAGTPIARLSGFGNTTLTLPGSYMALSCGEFARSDQTAFTNYTDADTAAPDSDYDCTWSARAGGTRYQMAVSVPCNTTGAAMTHSVTRPARQLVWESISNTTVFSRAVCDLTTTYVLLNVTCGTSPSNTTSGATCAAQAVQRTLSPRSLDSNWTVLDTGFYGDAGAVLKLLTGLFPNAQSRSDGLQPVVVYMSQPTDILNGYLDTEADMPIDELDRAVFEARLGQLLNTVLYLGINATVMVGNFDGSNATDVAGGGLVDIHGTISSQESVVRCQRAWFGVLFAAAFIVFLAAVASTALRLATLVPDVLDSISLAFLHNRTADLGGSSAWSVSQWALQTRSYRLRLGDVEPTADVGRIALATVTKGSDIGRVQAGRTYW